jgi:hypothetical protein
MITVILYDFAGRRCRLAFSDWRRAWAFVGFELKADRAKQPLLEAFPTFLGPVLAVRRAQ